MNELLKIIQHRQSARTPFNIDKPVKKQDLQKILEAARWAPTAHNMQNFEIMVVDDKNLLDKIRNIKFSTSFDFIKENYQQMSFSKEELKRKKVGVLGTMFPLSWRNPNLKPEDIITEEEKEHPKLERHNQMLSTPVLLLVLYDPKRRAPASEGDFLGIMSLGCMMENMWLMANSLGIGFHVISSLSAPEAEKELRTILGIPENLEVAISFRLGYPVGKMNYLRVRRDVGDFTYHNYYGTKDIEKKKAVSKTLVAQNAVE